MTDLLSLVVATHNAHKLAEFTKIVATTLPQASCESYDGSEPIENGTTFTQNALIKARTAAEHTGRPVFADDSGLSVKVMNGAPGIFSARWGGVNSSDEYNRQLLLQQLADIAPANRLAKYVCAIALVIPAGWHGRTETTEHLVEGNWPGLLLTEERGSNGFGYDPIFAAIPDDGMADLLHPENYAELLRTLPSSAELDPEVKNSISHRARAFEKLVPILQQEFGSTI